MHPVQRFTNPFPHHINQMPYGQHCYPHFEAVPPQMKMDASRSPVPYEAWPYGGNFGHPIPVGCHGCCNHSYFPGNFGFRPPYPHYPPPSPFHYPGGYPSFPETYPVHYVPPPYYSMDQPRYEYDKNVGRDHHCCVCLNHPCNKKEDKPIKIEEQEPELEMKSNGEKKSSNSLVPGGLNNQPYPVVWIPSEYMNKGERNPEVKERDEYPHDARAHENLTFPFPIFWRPYKPQEEERREHKEASDVEEGKTGRVSSGKSPSDMKAISAHFPGGDEKSGGEVCQKTMKQKYANQKLIPVKQVEDHEKATMTEEAEAKSRGIIVKDKEESKEKKTSENGTKTRSSSPPKTSKLPPVCLRVDPLPKRKKGNGSSRSPSPPGRKENPEELCGERTKTTSPRGKENVQHDMHPSSCTLNKAKEVEPKEKERKVVDAGHDEEGKVQSHPQISTSVPIDSHDEVARDSEDETIYCQSGDGKLQMQEHKGASEAKEENPDEVKKAERMDMSEVGAAVLIQSAYRGFEVRRWEPLRKMKQIAEVREQVGEVRRRIQDLASCTDIKQRVVLGETIMSLLLKLDTIQGLHPSIRDFRKSVAKELVGLQEKLDSLSTTIHEIPTTELVEHLPMKTGEYASIQGEQMEADVKHEKGIDQSDHQNNFGSPEPFQDQVSHVQESMSSSPAVETFDLKPDENGVSDEPEDKTTASLIGSSVVSDKAEVEPVNGLKDEVPDVGQVMMVKPQGEDLELKLLVESLPLVAEVNIDSVDGAKLSSSPDDQLAEVQAVSNQQLGIEESHKYEQIESVYGKVEYPLQVAEDTEGENGGERVFELDEDTGVNQSEIQAQTQEVVRLDDHVEKSKTEDEVSGKDNELEMEELGVEKQGVQNTIDELIDTSEQQESQTRLSLAHTETHDGEASKPEVSVELSLAEHETHVEKASIPEEEPLPELSAAQNEVHGGEQKEESGMNDDDDESSRKEKEGPIDECKQEENLGLVEDPLGCEGLDSVAGSNEVNAPQLAPAAAEQHEAKQIYVESDIGSKSDTKLLEENEKLREMMEKLIEAGREQLTTISNLSGRVKDLEKKLARKKKARTRRVRAGSSCAKPSNDSLHVGANGVAV